MLKQGEVHIGKAVARLTGTYSTAQETPSVQMKLDGQNMPAADLEANAASAGRDFAGGDIDPKRNGKCDAGD